ncbi:MAG: hypothetical protein HQM13_11760 [SAR324 cluster bacterium]|nr:hypothetical protein [SAR324 cluster bacterium]
MKKFSLISTLQIVFAAVSASAFLFSLWVLYLIPFYGDDLWHLSSLRSYTFWDLLTKPVFGDSNHIPVFHLWMWLLSFLPHDFPWIHLVQGGLLILTCFLFHIYLLQMSIPAWIRWMSTALFLTTPTIAQAVFWSSATHLWFGSIWILSALILLPRRSEESVFWRWSGCFICLPLAMMSTELSYGFCVLFIVLVALKYRRNFKIFSGCLITSLLMVAIVAQRNHLVTGNWAQLSLDRELERPLILKEIYISAYELFVYSHPLSMLDKFSQGYLLHERLSEGWLAFHLAWMTLFWFIILMRRGRNGWDLALLVFTPPLMIIIGNGLVYERYLIASIIANGLGMAIFVDCFRPLISGKLAKTFGVLAIFVVLINLSVFVRHSLAQWVNTAVRHHAILDLVQREHPDVRNPIGLVDSLSQNFRPLKDREWMSAPTNTVHELQMILSNLNYPYCLYDLLDELPFEGYKYRDAHMKSLNNLKKQCIWPPQKLRCYKYFQTSMVTGEFHSYSGQGKVLYLQEKNAVHPQEHLVRCL